MTSSCRSTLPPDHLIAGVRQVSRKLVRELGFLRSTFAGTEFSFSAVHALIEIGQAPGLQARDLAATLRLDKSSLSRQLARLEAKGLIIRKPIDHDGRSSGLYLTEAGAQLRAEIDRFSNDQVSRALARLRAADQQAVHRAIALYADALAPGEIGDPGQPARLPGASIREGYHPGCVGDIVNMHARYYARHAGFGVFFEKRVATELAAFAELLPADGKGLWLIVQDGRTLASIAIDGDPNTRTAHLRWFIVDDSVRGTGLGRVLLGHAMDFVDRRYDETFLWTVKGLDAARHLYDAHGFRLAEEFEGRQWGTTMTEQRLVRRRGACI